ncbi:hypothetical protein P691DRAFT_842780 [Macrolepiota fuliginosa MF-IS2]|uniref:Uncharacterized protein n=1 Tax=Macrolepiota fuliginosa MF-IS2 TaxID=1400762 RepID=A0A9P6BZA1_9AGAR|nr:hypothetical protein P691DRAFT_842780 [Macrolepiota fuliginosa MF-IS2]
MNVKIPRPIRVRKSGFVGRVLVFIVLEFGFLGLAYRWLMWPVPIYPSPFASSTEIKAITTAIAVIWHACAAFVVKDIALSVLSAECMAQYQRTGQLMPNKTDEVSQITSGLLVQTSYFFTTRPTLEYRLAFILVLLVMVLGPLGPSVISVGESLGMQHQEIHIANLTSINNFTPCYPTATAASQIEIGGGGLYGYRTIIDGLLLPGPELGLETSQDTYTYESDIAAYDYNCRWPKFSFQTSSSGISGILLADDAPFHSDLMTGALPWNIIWMANRQFFKIYFGTCQMPT